MNFQIFKLDLEKAEESEIKLPTNKGPSSQGYGFSSGHVWMWELDYKEIWVPKKDAFELLCLEDSCESLGLQEDPTSPA